MGNVFKAIPERRPFSSYSAIGDSRQCPTCRGSGVIQDGGFFMPMMFYLANAKFLRVFCFPGRLWQMANIV